MPDTFRHTASTDRLDVTYSLVKDWALLCPASPTMSATINPLRKLALRETALFLVLLFCGMLLLPMAIFMVGKSFFGSYAGAGFAEFFGHLHSEIRGGNPIVWFLVMSPYLFVQTLRLGGRLFRWLGGS